jgi:hypothetical protein
VAGSAADLARSVTIIQALRHTYSLCILGLFREEIEAPLTSFKVPLCANEWAAGDSLWLIDVVAPFGDQNKIICESKKYILNGEMLNMRKPTLDGRVLSAVKWWMQSFLSGPWGGGPDVGEQFLIMHLLLRGRLRVGQLF